MEANGLSIRLLKSGTQPIYFSHRNQHNGSFVDHHTLIFSLASKSISVFKLPQLKSSQMFNGCNWINKSEACWSLPPKNFNNIFLWPFNVQLISKMFVFERHFGRKRFVWKKLKINAFHLFTLIRFNRETNCRNDAETRVTQLTQSTQHRHKNLKPSLRHIFWDEIFSRHEKNGKISERVKNSRESNDTLKF